MDEPIEPHQAQVILAVDDVRLRERLARLFRSDGHTVLPLERAWDVIALAPSRDVVVLEAGHDVARLMQIVFELYWRIRPTDTLPIIALVWPGMMERNPTLAFWTLGGNAAVMAKVLIGRKDTEPGLLELTRRVVQGLNEEQDA